MASTRSACLSGKRGAIIVNNFKVLATGYNGTPAQFPNCASGGCKACCQMEICECLCIHAEINALIEAGRSRTIGSQLFSTHFPCFNCAKSIVQSEVGRLVFSHEESFDEEIASFLNDGGVDVKWQSPVVPIKDFEV
jgi:dCMP deaminase